MFSSGSTRLFGVVGGVVAAEVIWVVAEFVFGVPLYAPAGNGYPEPVSIDAATVAIASAVLALVGWGLLVELERLTSHAARVWLVVAVLALAASLFMPLGGAGVSALNRGILVVMHLAVGAVVISVLYLTSLRARVGGRPARIAEPEAV